VRERDREHSLYLTEDEAMGLLEIVMVSPCDLTPEQHAAVLKLGNFCRRFLHDGDEEVYTVAAPVAHPIHSPRMKTVPATT
jgi:hypothetical protein